MGNNNRKRVRKHINKMICKTYMFMHVQKWIYISYRNKINRFVFAHMLWYIFYRCIIDQTMCRPLEDISRSNNGTV